MRIAALALAPLLAAAPLSGASLAESIHALLDSSPDARTAFWGIQVVDLASGKLVYELNPNHNFVPASNTKLFTTAME
jgi:D-alanyl-D-alanine carboxypeptidase